MPQHRNKAVVAGLAVTLALGGVALPAVANTEQAPATDSDPNGMGLPAPASYDKADFYQGTDGVATFARARSASSLEPVALSDEMKYFAKYESNCNYDQGLSYGDGYNAMGYYQFDRRYSLLPFIQQVYDYNPSKYGMFASVLAQRDVLSNGAVSLYDSTTRQLTAPAQALNEAWHAAYAADPAEFSALQDSYAYNNYYLPVQSMLQNTYGVDVRDRADCVKGLVWGMCNLFGQGGVQNYLRDANLNNSMTDRELVVALCDTVVERVTYYCSSQPQYWEGWQNRYRKEKAQCLKYLDEHEAEQNVTPAPQPELQPEPEPQPEPQPEPEPQPQPEPEPQPDVDAKPGEDAAPAPEPGPAPESKPDSKPQDQSQPDSTPSPDADNGQADAPAPDAPESDGNSAPNAPGSQGNGGAQSNGVTGQQVGGSNAVTPGAGSQSGAPADKTPQAGSGSSEQPNGEESSNGGTPQTDTDDSSSTPDKEASKKDDGKTSDDGKKADDSMNTLGVSGKSQETGAKAQPTSGSAEKTSGTKAGLPSTGDITAMVLTGAAGLAAAGASFLSLGKKERTNDEGSDGQGDE